VTNTKKKRKPEKLCHCERSAVPVGGRTLPGSNAKFVPIMIGMPRNDIRVV
jgi:hypothetical protein